MKKVVLTIASGLLASGVLCAQSLEPTVIGSSGDHGSSTSGSVSWTLGEVMTETYSAGNHLTQGFHQPWATVSGIEDVVANQISVYPNPVQQFLSIDLQSVSGDLILEIYDAAGKKVLSNQLLGNQVHQMDVSALSAGTYIVSLRDRFSNPVKSLKLLKSK